jgi:subtilisin family serine protease
MPRYILANRRAGKFTPEAKIASQQAVHDSFTRLFAASSGIVLDSEPQDPTARRVVVFEAEEDEAAAKMKELPPDVLMEPAIPHYIDLHRPVDFLRRAAGPAPALPGAGNTLRVTVRGGGQPLEGADAILFLRGPSGNQTQQKGRTSAAGQVAFAYSSFWSPAALVVLPAGGFWSTVVRGPSGTVTVDCPALPDADKSLGWWHNALGVAKYQKTRGKDVKVGVIDTGCGPHPALAHVTLVGAFLGGQPDPQGGADVDSHGSHVCGIIGAKPTPPAQFSGTAPGCSLFCARVFPDADTGADQGDIVLALDELSRNRQADLINMSLGAKQASQIEHDAILDALERGTLCVCAAGNSAGTVEWPARFPESVAVSAIGLDGWGPPGTLASTRLPEEPEKFGHDHFYLANFSCFGDEISCSAPGVGILSTVPERFGLAAPYAAMDGTSMASPAACGAMAVILSGSAEYKQLPRDRTRAEMARRLLASACRDIGLAPRFQGRGMPQV